MLWEGNFFCRVCHSVQGSWPCPTFVQDRPPVRGHTSLYTGLCLNLFNLDLTGQGPNPFPPRTRLNLFTMKHRLSANVRWNTFLFSIACEHSAMAHSKFNLRQKKRTRGNNNSTKRLLLNMDSGALLESSYCLWNEDQSLHPTLTSIIKPWWSTNYWTLRSKTAYSL